MNIVVDCWCYWLAICNISTVCPIVCNKVKHVNDQEQQKQCLALVNTLYNEMASSWVCHVYHGCIKRTNYTCKRHEREAHERVAHVATGFLDNTNKLLLVCMSTVTTWASQRGRSELHDCFMRFWALSLEWTGLPAERCIQFSSYIHAWPTKSERRQ